MFSQPVPSYYKAVSGEKALGTLISCWQKRKEVGRREANWTEKIKEKRVRKMDSSRATCIFGVTNRMGMNEIKETGRL